MNEPVCLVTGAASGIGAAVARRFAASGHPVGLVDVNESGLTAMTEELGTVSGGTPVIGAVADMADASQVTAVVATVASRIGPPTVLVTCAGVSGAGRIEDLDMANWDTTMAVNVRSVVLLAQAMVPHFRESGRGSIVTVASIAALVASSGRSAYSTSKGALVALTKALAIELGPIGVRANSVCPGSVNTPFSRSVMIMRGGGDVQTGLVRSAAMHPVGHVADPDEIAAVIAFLASDDASFISGEAVVADGGMLAKMPITVPEVAQ